MTTQARRSTGAVVHLRRSTLRHLPPRVRRLLAPPPRWTIAVRRGATLQDAGDWATPVFDTDALDRLGVVCTADPFALHRDGTWYLFFEILRRGSDRGQIGLATSTDLQAWTYRGVVLSEPFHLSFPQVLEVRGETWMVPETAQDGAVRLYRATRFPEAWELDTVLLKGAPYKDNAVVVDDGQCWLFTETSADTHDELRLFHARDLRGPWTEHPASPIVRQDARYARSAGRPVRIGDTWVRFAQDCSSRYGRSVHALAIEELTPAHYRERLLTADVVAPGQLPWHRAATHHLDAHATDDGWLCFVDGHG